MSRVVIVTGSSRGIGLAVCKRLLQKDARVVSVSRTPATDPVMVKAIDDSNAVHVEVDLAVPGSSQKIISAALAKFGRIDSVVFNAGVLDIAPIASMSMDSLRRLMDVNLLSVFELAQQSLPHLRGHGRMVFVSSGAASKAYPGWSSYCMSKSALNMLAECIAVEEPSITSVSVRPGVVDTAMQEQIREPENAVAMTPSGHARFTQMHSAGKLVAPEDPASVIAGLSLNAAADLSGKFISWDEEEILMRYRQ